MDKGLAKTRSRLIAALDVGTTKTCCFIARLEGNDGLKVIGVGHQNSIGMRAGAIIDMEAIETSILSAIHGAETMAGEHIRAAFVNVSGGRPNSRTVGAEIAVAGNEISHSDVRRVLDECHMRANGTEQALIHSIPVGYSVDGSRGIRDPRGMHGDKLGVDIHLVTTGTGAVRNLATCLAGCRIDVRGYVVTPYASALSCLSEDEMDLGVTLVDMGGGTTTIAGFADGELVYTDLIAVGGGHVTNDIALGLNTPVSHAERLKALFGSAVPSPHDDQQVIDAPVMGEDDEAPPNQVARSLLVGIVQPRLEETFELLRDRLEAHRTSKPTDQRIVITGGASQMQGLKELAAPILDRPVRMGRPLNFAGLAESVCGPAFSTCAGLLRYAAFKHAGDPSWDTGAEEETGTLLNRVGGWIRENF